MGCEGRQQLQFLHRRTLLTHGATQRGSWPHRQSSPFDSQNCSSLLPAPRLLLSVRGIASGIRLGQPHPNTAKHCLMSADGRLTATESARGGAVGQPVHLGPFSTGCLLGSKPWPRQWIVVDLFKLIQESHVSHTLIAKLKWLRINHRN